MHFSVHKYIAQSTNSFNTDPVNAFAGSGIRSKFGAGFENRFDCYWDAVCTKMWALYAGYGKKMIFGMAMREVQDTAFSWKRSGNVGSEPPGSRSYQQLLKMLLSQVKAN